MKYFLYLFFLCFVLSANAQNPDSLISDVYHNQMFDYLEEINSGSTENFINAFNEDKFLDRMFADIPTDSYDLRQFRSGVKNSVKPSISSIFSSFTEFEYVNYTQTENSFSILIRCEAGEAGLNYLEFEVDIESRDELRIIDIFSYFSGEYISTTMNRNAKMIISENGMISNILNSLNIKEKEFTQSLPKLVKMQKYRSMGDFEEILKVYDSLSKSMKQEKIFLLTAISAAQTTDEMRYLKLIKEYENEFPDDPSLPLLTLDYYLLRGELETAHEQIDKLDEIVGGDNYLNVIRSTICSIAEDLSCARSYLETAIENNEFEEDAYFGLLELELASGNFKKVNDHLSALENIFGYEFSKESMQKVEIYKSYLESEEFKKWQSTKN